MNTYKKGPAKLIAERAYERGCRDIANQIESDMDKDLLLMSESYGEGIDLTSYYLCMICLRTSLDKAMADRGFLPKEER